MLFVAGLSRADTKTIERIDVIGNRRLTTDAFIFASGLKVGDAYDVENVRKAFRRLWDKGLFDDLKVEQTDGERGAIITFTVVERPLLVSVDYDKVKALTQSNIEDAFKQRGLDLTIGKPVSQKNLWKAAGFIKDLLGTKGYLDPTVTFKTDTISSSSVAVHFSIRQGPRTRIKKIDFVGNEVFSDHKLRGSLKQTRESSLINHISGKDLWRPALYDQDIQKVLELYRAYGFLDVEVKPPVVELLDPKKRKEAEAAAAEKSEAELERERKKAEKEAAKAAEKEAKEAAKAAEKEAKKKKRPPKPGAPPPTVKEKSVKRSVYLTVKVKEGPQYKLGTMDVKGNTVFTAPQVLARIPLASGMILNDSALQAGLDRLRAEYGTRGYIYATATKSVVRHENNVADVTIEIDEDQAYVVDRIEFEGNTVTRDSVLRREMRVNEGDILSKDRLDVSNYKIQQLGFIKPDPDPAIEPLIDTNLADVKLKLEEQGRNEIQVGGGYSGTDGFFFQGSYSTRNFLGRGEVLSAYAEIGGRRNLYSISFTEPWFMGRPYLVGFSIFKRNEDFAQNQSRQGSGGTIQVGRQLGNFSQVRAIYAFEKVDYAASTVSQNFGSGAVSPVSAVNIATTTTIASITPSISYDRVNNPFRPTAGRNVFIASQVAGQVLGGDNSFWKPQIRYTEYIPFVRRTYFGVHLEGGYIVPFGDGVTQGSQIENVPVFERYFIGGEFIGPRIFETRSISPIAFISRNGSEITGNRRDIIGFKGTNIFGDPILVKCDPRFDIVNTGRRDSLGRPIEVPGPSDQVCNIVQDRVGGNRYALAQLEFAVPIASPFTLAFFLDAGNAWAESEELSFDRVRVSGGIEARLFLPVFQAPVRFIFGKSIRSQPLDTTNSFQFSIGTSF